MHTINKFVIFIPVISAGLIQATAFDYIGLLGIKPDLLLIIVVFFALSCSRDQSVKSAVAAGLTKDITSSSILGSYTVSFLLIALFLNYHQRKFYRERISTQILITFACYFFMGLLVLFFNLISDKTMISHYLFLYIVFKGAVYTGLISPLVFFVLSKTLRIRLAPRTL